MLQNLRLPRIIECLEQACGEFLDVRTGKNSVYDLRDTGMNTFSVFFTQSLFLAHQLDMKLRKGRSRTERWSCQPVSGLVIALAKPVGFLITYRLSRHFISIEAESNPKDREFLIFPQTP